MKIWARRLRELREKHHLSLTDVEARTGIGNRALGHYERSYREMDLATLKKLADFYGVSTDYILGRENETGQAVALLDTVRIPVLAESDIVAGGVEYALERCEEHLYIPRMLVEPRSFLVAVSDESMSPVIEKGDYVIVSPGPGWRDGDLYLLCDGERLIVRRLIATARGVLLQPFNQKHKPDLVSADQLGSLILGKVTGLWRRF